MESESNAQICQNQINLRINMASNIIILRKSTNSNWKYYRPPPILFMTCIDFKEQRQVSSANIKHLYPNGIPLH